MENRRRCTTRSGNSRVQPILTRLIRKVNIQQWANMIMRDVIWHADSVSETKNSGKLLTIAWLASTACSSRKAVWSVWNNPLLKSQNVNQAVNHYESAFWYFYCYLRQPDPWFHENTADPDPACFDSRSRGCDPWSRPFIGLWSLIPYTSLRPCYKK